MWHADARALRRFAIFLVAAGVLCVATPALAQTRVRVVADQANIWRPGFLTLAAVVNKGAVLDVVSRQGNWLEVVVPSPEGSRQTGFIAIAQVTPVTGTIPADRTPATPQSSPNRRPAVRRVLPPRTSGVRGFGDIDFRWFAAHDTFHAVFDRPGGLFAGGGVQFRLHDALYVEAAVRRFQATGERAFIDGSDIFRLGISDTLTITPITATAGARFPRYATIPYLGVGFGSYQMRETSDFSTAAENPNVRLLGYHFVAGVEWRSRSMVHVAVEMEYAHIPNAFTGPLADALAEHNGGGVALRARVLIGK